MKKAAAEKVHRQIPLSIPRGARGIDDRWITKQLASALAVLADAVDEDRTTPLRVAFALRNLQLEREKGPGH